ncbi:MAG: MlaD family protein [Simkaniaceae bacterium]|nr:MlaD family protein [Simkaniaceae bacterium]
MADQLKNMLIGFFVVIALGLIVGMILFIEPSVGDGKQTLIVRFSNLTQINVGTRVLFAGRPVGEVSKIEKIPHAREQPIDHAGNVYYYQLILHIDSSIKVYNTDEITVQTSGLLGERSIAIVPKAPPKGVKPKVLTSRDVVYAESMDPLENAFNELSELAEKVDEAINQFMAWFDDNRDSLSFAVASFGDAMHEISLAVEEVNKLGVMKDVKKTTEHLASTMEAVDEGIHQLQKDRFFMNLGVTMQNFKRFSSSADVIAQDLASGSGTIGKLITSDDMYLRMTAIMTKVDTLMNDINHYGFLFNYNKQWQRNRTQQVQFMNALRTPNEFKNYFEKEIDDINTAMARISMLIDKASEEPQRKIIFENVKFQRDFSELMRQVNEMSSNLKLYNQELVKILNEEAS